VRASVAIGDTRRRVVRLGRPVASRDRTSQDAAAQGRLRACCLALCVLMRTNATAQVERLDEDRRVELIRRVLRQHSKRLNESQEQVRCRHLAWSDSFIVIEHDLVVRRMSPRCTTQRIARAPQTGNPRYLVTLLEDIAVWGNGMPVCLLTPFGLSRLFYCHGILCCRVAQANSSRSTSVSASI
jgi:hypothetical protein